MVYLIYILSGYSATMELITRSDICMVRGIKMLLSTGVGMPVGQPILTCMSTHT